MRFRIRNVAMGAGLLGTALLASGCSDAERVAGPVAPNPVLSLGVVPADSVAALHSLTRSVALALQDEGLRQRVKNDMRASRFTHEHKLEFAQYLKGNSGGILLAKMAKESGKTREEMLALLGSVEPLEFYMPVPEHRETWSGGTDLLISGSLDEENKTLVGYNLAGERVAISPDIPPETPTLVLVPVETHFATALDLRTYRNTRDAGGKSIGTYDFNTSCETCLDDPGDGESSGGGGGWTKPSNSVQRRGVSVEEFISHMKTPNDHEPWNLGAPEFYLLLAGKRSGGIDFSNRINIPEGPWSGSDDDNNSKWRNFAANTGPIPLMVWDTDLGTRVSVQCFEDDFDWSTDHTVRGSTKYPGTNLELSYAVTFKIGAGDDNCGSSFINLQNTLGQFYYIPDGKNDDATNPAPPYYDGPSDLHWYGYGLQRL